MVTELFVLILNLYTQRKSRVVVLKRFRAATALSLDHSVHVSGKLLCGSACQQLSLKGWWLGLSIFVTSLLGSPSFTSKPTSKNRRQNSQKKPTQCCKHCRCKFKLTGFATPLTRKAVFGATTNFSQFLHPPDL